MNIDTTGIGIIATAHYLPEKVQTNDELVVNIPDITPEWIIEKTGIRNRRIIAENETASSMSLNACNDVLLKAGITGEDLGLIMVASFSQDYLFPPLSAKIHSKLGATKDCQILDINTNCTGFVTATTIAVERMKANPKIKYSLIIGVEVLTRFTNPADKDTAIFFSDGAAAILLGRVPQHAGYINAAFRTDTSTYESVRLRGGGSTYSKPYRNFLPEIDFIEQNGLATWKQAVANLPVVINSVIAESNISIADVDFFVFHQANDNLISYILKKLRIPEDRTYNNVKEIGNTGAASIGIALSEAFDKGLIKPGSFLVLAGVGAGFNFGANLWKMQ